MYYYGKQVRLRPSERVDLPLFVQWLSNPEMRDYVTVRYMSLALEERWFDGTVTATGGGAPDKLHFVIEARADNKPIGVIGLEHINWRDRETEVGITIGESEYWGKGYGTDAMRTILMVGFHWYNLHRIYLRVVADNARAVRSYEKCGFQHEGCARESVFINGVYKDLLWMSMLAHEFKVEDSE